MPAKQKEKDLPVDPLLALAPTNLGALLEFHDHLPFLNDQNPKKPYLLMECSVFQRLEKHRRMLRLVLVLLDYPLWE